MFVSTILVLAGFETGMVFAIRVSLTVPYPKPNLTEEFKIYRTII